jgi:hypothetical protein
MPRRSFCNGGRRKEADIAIRVMVTAKEQAEIESGEQGGDADVGLCSRQGA